MDGLIEFSVRPVITCFTAHLVEHVKMGRMIAEMKRNQPGAPVSDQQQTVYYCKNGNHFDFTGHIQNLKYINGISRLSMITPTHIIKTAA